MARYGIYKSLNALVQGSAAIHTKLWLLAVWRAGITPLLQIHDELFCSVKTREQGELIAKLGCEAVALEVPIKADLGYGWSWGDAKHKWENLPPTPEPAPKPPVPALDPSGNVIELPLEDIAITEFSPFDENALIGKCIESCNHILPYPKVMWWTQAVAKIPATMVALEGYFREARKRNICIIRGAPIDPSLAKTLRRKTHFDDEPSRLLCIDIDGATGVVACQSGSCGPAHRRAVGRTVRLGRCGLVLHGRARPGDRRHRHGQRRRQQDQAVDRRDRRRRGAGAAGIHLRPAAGLQRGQRADAAGQGRGVRLRGRRLPRLSGADQLRQANALAAHPDQDPLGDIQTIGLIEGAHENLIVPDDLSHKARWARAQGHGGVIASHPNAVSAVRAIGADGSIRDHLFSALWHLARANPMPSRPPSALTITP